MPVGKLKKSITYRHFRELMEYENRNVPFESRAEYYFAQIASTIVNMQRDPASPAASLNDYILDFSRKETRQLTVEETEAALVAMLGRG